MNRKKWLDTEPGREATLHPMSLHIAARAKIFRKTLGLTQKTVAERMNMPVQNYQRLEWGIRNWTLPKVLLLASVMRIPYIKLLEGYVPPTERTAVPPGTRRDVTDPSSMAAPVAQPERR